MSTSDPSEIIKQLRGGGVATPLNSKSLSQSPREWYQPFLTDVADLIESLTADLSRLEAEVAVLTERTTPPYGMTPANAPDHPCFKEIQL